MTSYFAPNDYRAKTYDVFVSYKRERMIMLREVLVLALELAGDEVLWTPCSTTMTGMAIFEPKPMTYS